MCSGIRLKFLKLCSTLWKARTLTKTKQKAQIIISKFPKRCTVDQSVLCYIFMVFVTTEVFLCMKLKFMFFCALLIDTNDPGYTSKILNIVLAPNMHMSV